MKIFNRQGWALLIATTITAGLMGCDGNSGDNGFAPPSHTHTWGEWVVTTPATCDATGVETRTCWYDDATETRAMTAVDPISVVKSTLIDNRDGKEYKTIKICRQTWIAENLNYEAAGSSYCSYCDTYGRYYDWNTARTVCPSGYSLPSIEDWVVLFKAVGLKNVIYDSIPSDPDASWHWWIGIKSKKLRGVSWGGTNDYWFSALPGGCGGRCNYYVDGPSSLGGGSYGNDGYWWSSSTYYGNDERLFGDPYLIKIGEYSMDKIYMMMTNGFGEYSDNYVDKYLAHKDQLFSVRCVKTD
jgi:uncharacterized protein (TIGR02145 family)